MAFLPLSGVRVVDVTSSVAGPSCTQLLAALGADVVKVEHPERGDDSRIWGPPFWHGESAMFLSQNAGKRSVGLDLKSEHGLEALLRLVDRADVFLQSLRPGLAGELGLGPDALRARNPRLVYLSLGAYGREGPLAHQPGYDPMMQAASGILSVTGPAGGPPARVGIPAIDAGTGQWAAIGILAALRERERTGEGALVEVALYETALSLMQHHLVGYLATGVPPTFGGTGLSQIVPYQVFETRDGGVMIAAANDNLFERLCAALDRPELARDERFRTNAGRTANRAELLPLLDRRIAQLARAELLAALDAAAVPAAPVQDVSEVVAHPQTEASGMLQPLPHPRVDDLRTVNLPLSVDGERVRHRSAPPLLGAHTEEVLRELGYEGAELERFLR